MRKRAVVHESAPVYSQATLCVTAVVNSDNDGRWGKGSVGLVEGGGRWLKQAAVEYGAIVSRECPVVAVVDGCGGCSYGDTKTHHLACCSTNASSR